MHSAPGKKPTLASCGDRPDSEDRVKLGQGSEIRESVAEG